MLHSSSNYQTDAIDYKSFSSTKRRTHTHRHKKEKFSGIPSTENMNRHLTLSKEK